MSESNANAAVPFDDIVEHDAAVPYSDPTRRAMLLTALATCACLATAEPSIAEDDQPGSNERPQKADMLVFSEGEHAGEVIKPGDLKPGGPPVRAWPKDPKTAVIRNGSRLNEILVVRLDPAELDDDDARRARPTASSPIRRSVRMRDVRSPAGSRKRRATRSCSNASATIPNMIPRRRRASRVRAGAAAPCRASARDRRRFAHRRRNFIGKVGACSTRMNGRAVASGLRTTME